MVAMRPGRMIFGAVMFVAAGLAAQAALAHTADRAPLQRYIGVGLQGVS